MFIEHLLCAGPHAWHWRYNGEQDTDDISIVAALYSLLRETDSEQIIISLHFW